MLKLIDYENSPVRSMFYCDNFRDEKMESRKFQKQMYLSGQASPWCDKNNVKIQAP